MPAPGETRVLILTGPPGAGKTTAARVLADRWARAVHVESDRFFDFVRSGYVEPWKPESREQNEVVMRIVAGAAAAYASAGYFTIVDGIVLPRFFFEPLRDSAARRSAGRRAALERVRGPGAAVAARRRHRGRGPERGGRPARGPDPGRIASGLTGRRSVGGALLAAARKHEVAGGSIRKLPVRQQTC